MFFLIAFVTVPFTTVLVRYRLAYHPKETRPDLEAASADVGPTSTTSSSTETVGSAESVVAKPTFLSTAKRIYQLEALVATLFYSFALVWIYRSISTRYKLEIFGTSIKDGVNALFTPWERTKPYKIVSPALLATLLHQIVLQIFAFHPLREMLDTNKTHEIESVRILKAAGILGLLIIDTLICTPLDVIVTRLAVQTNQNALLCTTDDSVDNTTDIPHDEKSTTLTPELELPVDTAAVTYRGGNLEPYIHGYDCAKKIVNEEGWGVLYRGWFITFLGLIFS
ncbi:hypothetical protein H0H93_000996 [Arthromyces matolae]|nr:hypothetical protein H0H93_000996 [Arthromyces matolae]